ncbi:MAG: RluA family pseudouridine synthase [Planctomycetes bacterium]|nr:RluA family pseudouridine synthase [Planctomycetota bacterium]
MRVPADAAGKRLDVWLETVLEGCTRSQITRLIKGGSCAVEPGAAKAGYFLKGGETVTLDIPDVEPMEAKPEDIPLSILHEDAHLIVVDKPPGMVVHPAIGHLRGTLVNALLGRYGTHVAGEAWRPGIIHRLDADTSGVICVARTVAALAFVQDAFKARTVGKRYLALVAGKPRADFLENPKWIGRHPRDFRKRAAFAAETTSAKEAYTSFIVLHRGDGFAALEARPRTGRTHQIRIHLADLGHPVLADATYGRAPQWPLNAKPDDASALRRHGLHAWTLDIPHPAGGRLAIQAPIPADLARWLPPGLTPRPVR